MSNAMRTLRIWKGAILTLSSSGSALIQFSAALAAIAKAAGRTRSKCTLRCGRVALQRAAPREIRNGPRLQPVTLQTEHICQFVQRRGYLVECSPCRIIANCVSNKLTLQDKPLLLTGSPLNPACSNDGEQRALIGREHLRLG